MTRPTKQFKTICKPNGCLKTVKTFSYVVTLTRIGGDEVQAVRMDGYESKYDRAFREDLESNWPPTQWKCKNVLKLYDSDFMEEL